MLDVKAYVLVLQNINREHCRRLRADSNRVTTFAGDAEDDVTQIGMKAVKKMCRAKAASSMVVSLM